MKKVCITLIICSFFIKEKNLNKILKSKTSYHFNKKEKNTYEKLEDDNRFLKQELIKKREDMTLETCKGEFLSLKVKLDEERRNKEVLIDLILEWEEN